MDGRVGGWRKQIANHQPAASSLAATLCLSIQLHVLLFECEFAADFFHHHHQLEAF